MISSPSDMTSVSSLMIKGSHTLAESTDASSSTAFAAQLERAVQPRNGASREEQAQTAAEQLVATAFIRPMLEELGRATFASDQFKPGAGEKRMRPLLDAEISDRITAAEGFPLVDAVRDRLLGRHRDVSEIRNAVHA